MTSTRRNRMGKAERERREKELAWTLSRVEPRVECAAQGQRWQEVESEVREAARAKKMPEARRIARRITPLCGRCSVSGTCMEWAAVARYSGVAGGHIVVSGRSVSGS